MLSGIEVAHACELAADAHSLLRAIIGDDDGVTIDYLIGLLMDDEDDMEGAVELLGAHVENLPQELCADVMQRAAELVAQGKSKATEPPSAGLAAITLDSGRSEETAVEKGTTSECPCSKPSSHTTSSSAAAAPAVSSTSSIPAAADSEALRALQELVPDATAVLCDHALRRCAYEIADAVDFLLCGDLEALEAEAAWANDSRDAATRRLQEADRQSEKDLKKRVLERNGMVRDYGADGIEAPHLSAPRLPYSGSRKEALRGGGQRYLDGQVVATRPGEKHVVVNTQAEWDGGSTGKVITKGKRGKGFR
jgi:hypothetical protein